MDSVPHIDSSPDPKDTAPRPWFRAKTVGTALLVLCLASGAALTFVLWPEREPSYQGISASDWLEAASTNGAKVLPATEAFKAMGPEGATFLGNELLRKPSALDDWLLANHQKIPDRLKPTLLKPHRPVVNETVLSTEAKVNEQIILIDYGLDDVVLKACNTLATLGPQAAKARDALRPCLHHANERILAAAARALGAIGEAARDSVADLEPLQNHPRPEIQGAAREAIQKIVNAPAVGRN